jgi:alpha-ribazole phosphatase
MAEIFFVRHGQTNSNLRQLLHGRTDVPLTAVGLRQAELAAERLAELGGFSALYTSPLTRAAHTAETIAARVGLAPVHLADLSEFDFGDFEGLTLETIQQQYPEIFLRIGDLDDDDFRFPRGESRREFHARILRTTKEMFERHRDERLIVVAHGGVIGSAVAQLTGRSRNDWSLLMVHNASITHVEWTGHGFAVVHRWNDVEHLETDLLDSRAVSDQRDKRSR